MAATENSQYQALAAQHQTNSETQYQRVEMAEPYTNYMLRMKAHGLPPDINPDESDADYLTRLASYIPAPAFEYIQAETAKSADTAISSSYATTYTTVISSSFADVSTRSDTCGLADQASSLAGAVTNGTYNFDAVTPGNVSSFTIADGVITTITVVSA